MNSLTTPERSQLNQEGKTDLDRKNVVDERSAGRKRAQSAEAEDFQIEPIRSAAGSCSKALSGEKTYQ